MKKIITALFSIILLTSVVTSGVNVSAQGIKEITYQDLLGMSKAEILQLDLPALQSLMDYFGGLSKDDAQKIDNQIVMVVCNAWNAKSSELSYSKTLKAESLSLRSVSVTKGIDTTIYSATLGDAAEAYTGNIDVSYNADVGFNRNQLDISGTWLGAGNVWVYTGESFTVSGSGGSQQAYIRFNGFSYADVSGGLNSSATFTVTAEVYQYVSGAWSRIASSNIYDLTTGGSYDDYGGSIAESLVVSLASGNTYQVRLKTYAQVDVPLFSFGASVYSYSPNYTLWSSINIDWQ
ncbi:MAG: hypothetical protein A9183_07300 [Dehalococcoides mccartyi]|uniref:hypothetical protein n=1 Tax=Dehalococcoides mccartyi TaxID=61435 RepID=UPI0008060010|nr:hypothetical protein [Dehalococcoides mccartyi]OBW62524.1 MAG: hypothetical protein A9183_07300 [Dehalococcoides mccartyi]